MNTEYLDKICLEIIKLKQELGIDHQQQIMTGYIPQGPSKPTIFMNFKVAPQSNPLLPTFIIDLQQGLLVTPSFPHSVIPDDMTTNKLYKQVYCSCGRSAYLVHRKSVAVSLNDGLSFWTRNKKGYWTCGRNGHQQSKGK